MSERRLRTPSNTSSAGISKQPRKQNLRPTEDDKQKERKRALDRKAQRISREKTRSHIAQLEKTVQMLSDKHGTAATTELLEENTRLHTEIDRLRKIIDNIRSVLGADVCGASDPSESQRHSPSSQENKNLERNNTLDQSVITGGEVHSPPEQQYPILQHQVPDNWEGGSLDDMPTEVGQVVPEHSLGIQSNRTRETYNLGAGIDDDSTLVLASRWNNGGPNFPVFHRAAPPFQLPCLYKNGLLVPPIHEIEPCKLWQTANAIYANIFNYSKERRREGSKVEPGSLIKVVKGGWGSLSLKERGNPILQILQKVDQNLFWDLDPVTKVANLYKSMLLLKYFFNSNTDNLNRMPDWQRPIPSQRARQHPIPIDFFPWPTLRDRLVRHHRHYFATTEFASQYRLHFKFMWPFSFDDIYHYDPRTSSYAISPLFDQFHRDMRCWSLEPLLFDTFPELIGEIAVYEPPGAGPPSSSAASSSSSSSSPPVALDPSLLIDPRAGDPHHLPPRPGALGRNFDDGDLMGLFDECPPT